MSDFQFCRADFMLALTRESSECTELTGTEINTEGPLKYFFFKKLKTFRIIMQICLDLHFVLCQIISSLLLYFSDL